MGKNKHSMEIEPNQRKKQEKQLSKSDPKFKEDKDIPLADIINNGISSYKRALSGDEKAARDAYELFRSARKKYSGNNLLNAYFAASSVLVSEYEKNLVARGKNIYMALDLLDKIVAIENNAAIRNIRATICLKLPGYFNRASTAIEDLEYLKEQFADQSTIEAAQAYKNILLDIEKAKLIKSSVPPHIQKMLDNFAERKKKAIK